MKFRSVSIPESSIGLTVVGPKLTVPDQAMSLAEILMRFTRNEALPIDQGGVYHESEDDLGKVGHLDLVERAEFVERQKETQKRFQQQEKEKERKRLEALEADERAKIAAQIRAEGTTPSK